MTHLIRAAELADSVDLSYIGARSFPSACAAGTPQEAISTYIASELTIAKFEEHIACPTKSIFTALVDSKICGYLMLCREEVPTDLSAQRPIELRRIYVLPEQQGSGMASELMMCAIREAISGNHDTLWLSVSGDNKRGIGFYRKHGFTVVGNCYFPLAGIVYQGFLMSRNMGPNNSFKPTPHRGVGHVPTLR